MSDDPKYTIRRLRLEHGTYSWVGQALQYPQRGEPNEIVYRREYEDHNRTWIDTLLAYSDDGYLVGILNHYPQGATDIQTGDKLEQPGGINTFIQPNQPKTVLKTLITEAKRRWPNSWVKPEDEMGVIKRNTIVDSELGRQMVTWARDQDRRSDGTDGNRRKSRTRRLNR